jgi:integrase
MASSRARYGSGSVDQLGPDRWRLTISLGFDPITGKRRRTSKVVRVTSKRAAQTELSKFLTEQHALAASETLRGVIREYLDLAVGDPNDLSTGMSPTTRAENEGAVERYVPARMLDRRVRDLTTKDLDTLYTHLLRRGGVCSRRGNDETGEPRKCTTTPCKHGGGDPLSTGTVRRLHGVIRSALEQAVRWNYVTTNVAKNTREIEVIADEVELPPADDLVKLLAALDELTVDGPNTNPYAEDRGSPLPDFVALSMAMGPRPGEPCALRWGAIDLHRETSVDGTKIRYGVVTVAESVTRARGGAKVKGTKTNKVRRVTISAPVCEILEARRARWRPAALAAGIPIDEMFVFPSKQRAETPWRPDSMGRELRRIRDELELSKQITFRNLRHYCVSLLAANGVDLVTAAKRMGHSPDVFLRVYAHLFEAHDLHAAEILGLQAITR